MSDIRRDYVKVIVVWLITLASLYATLYRLEERGLLRGRWVEKSGQRRRRYYRITDEGAAVLKAQRQEWGRFITALSQVAGVRPA